MNNNVNVNELTAQALLTEFSENQIFHDDVPENGTYPMICYENLVENPSLHADNKIYARNFVIRVTIVTFGNAGIENLKKKVENCMKNAGFMWQNTNKVRDGKEYYTALDFSIGMLEN